MAERPVPEVARRTVPFDLMRLSLAFDRRSNALNTVRLVLALTVLAVHSWHLVGQVEPHLGALRAHELAVDGFFAISGFLIVDSYQRRSSTWRYLWHRALRLLPAYWLCLLTVGLLAMALGAGVEAVGYVLANFSVVQQQWGAGAVFADNPFPSALNGSLWSLPYELACYLLVACGLARALPAAAAGSWLWLLLQPGLMPRLLLMFTVGALFFRYARRVPMRRMFAVSAAALLLLSAILPSPQILGAVPLTYLLLYAGCHWRTRVASAHDVSYGVYIYAFPVQQALALVGIRSVPVMLLLATAMVLPLAWLSRRYIETPALRLRHAELPSLARSRPAVT